MQCPLHSAAGMTTFILCSMKWDNSSMSKDDIMCHGTVYIEGSHEYHNVGYATYKNTNTYGYLRYSLPSKWKWQHIVYRYGRWTVFIQRLKFWPVNQWPVKALYNVASHSYTHPHTDGIVNHGRRQSARLEQVGWGVLPRDTSNLSGPIIGLWEDQGSI